MTTLLICLFIATIMPIIAKVPLALAMTKEKGGYDNRNPREQQKALTGFGARAKAAHENSFEALLMFTPGILASIAIGPVGNMAEYLAIAFVAARAVYVLAYWFDLHLMRSAFWGIGFFASLGLIGLAISSTL